jgi:aryl-alcohol dehydrogenase-like predicted oxidoreductase
MENSKKTNMIYRYMGNTGVKVSAIGMGNMFNSYNNENDKLTVESVKKCLEYGVNFFDTAEFYGSGAAEI